MADVKKIADFFAGKPVQYDAQKGNVNVSLTLQHQEPSGWKHGIDHFCYADFTITWMNNLQGGANRNPSVSWQPGYFHVDSRAPQEYGGLWQKLPDYAGALCAMLTQISLGPNINNIRKAIYSLEEKFKEDFSGKELEKHFEREGSSSDDD